MTSLVHHCMVDISGIELLTAICDLQREVEPDKETMFEPDRNQRRSNGRRPPGATRRGVGRAAGGGVALDA